MSLRRWRIPLMALGGLSLLAAIWGGLIRLGWGLPFSGAAVPSSHGPLMVTGFLGTLIGLERAVAVKRSWAYGAPLLTGVGALALLAGASQHTAQALMAAGAALLVAVFLGLSLRYPALHLWVMTLAALLWVMGIGLWSLDMPLYRIVGWWVAFLVLTIAGERLELSRLLSLSVRSRGLFVLAAALVVAGLVVGLFQQPAGARLSGIGLLALAAWLLRCDIAWRTLRKEGRPRFMAVCLLSGHLWLAFSGLLWVFLGQFFEAGPYYDAMLHSVFLGFVFSMIFAHALIILPAVLGVALPFRGAFYAHWALLHLSLVLRVTGDLAGSAAAARWGGLGNALTIVVFLANSAVAVATERAEVP
jgi:hypothetical protein